MTKEEYSAYLLTPHWKDLRSRKIKAVGPRCQDCGSGKQIQVHHLRYRNIYDVLLDDLKVLCRVHHEAAHGIKPVIEPPKKAPVAYHTPTTKVKPPDNELHLAVRSLHSNEPPQIVVFEWSGKKWICKSAPPVFLELLGLKLKAAKSVLDAKNLIYKTFQGSILRQSKPKRFTSKPKSLRHKHKKRKKPNKKHRLSLKPFFASGPRRRMNWIQRGNSSN